VLCRQLLAASTGVRVIKFNTLLRVVYTLGLYLILSQVASAQTVLNFAKATVSDTSDAGFAVTNPTSAYADVQFTFYGLDGNPVSSGLVNPVRYQIAPKAQISMRASDLFASAQVDGWVQVTSPTTGLTGFYLTGDFTTKLEGSEAAVPALTQVVPFIREDAPNSTDLVILNPNPGNANSSVIITFYGSRGDELGTSTQILTSHQAVRLRPSAIVPNMPGGNISAKISVTSGSPVAATAIIDRGNALLFAAGQSADQAPAGVRIAPHFVSGSGFDPVLVLTNPNASPVTGTVTLFGENGGAAAPQLPGPSVLPFTIAANGSVALTTVDITGRVFFTPITMNGWLRIDTGNIALDGLLILDQGQSMTAVPLQTSASTQMLYSEIFENQSTVTGLALVNPGTAAATVDMFLVEEDGTTFAQNSITIPPFSKFTRLVHEVLPDAVNQAGSYVFLRSSSPIYGVGMVTSPNTIVFQVPPAAVPPAFVPDPAGTTPRIQLSAGTLVQPNSSMRVTVTSGEVFTIDNKVVPSRLLAPGASTFILTLPVLEPGFVNLRVHSNATGADSPPVPLRVLPPDGSTAQDVSGKALYRKIDVTDSGLDLNHPVMFPIRNARVEVVDTASQSVVSVSETDARGRFTVPVPASPGLVIRVVSRLRSFDLRVADNTNSNVLYPISSPAFDGRQPASGMVLTDNTRLSGAFNILEVVERANATVKLADPNVVPPPVTIYWSTRNTNRFGNTAQGFIGTSEFFIASNTAFILGDRATDSDEYDDAVIAHEYAHMLAAKFSRDDSPGGPHSVGDMLDPRVAWSEGWANFFSSVVRNDAIWRDSYGPNGTQVLRYDLEDNSLAGDPKPGYWSEASVDTLLWDLYDDHVDPGDNVQFPFSQIWRAFTDLTNDRFVYLPYFLDHFLNRVPSAANDVVGMAQLRNIDYQPGAQPSVTNPFPTAISVGSVTTGIVDSYTPSPQRTNLITSSHFYTFTTTGGPIGIRMDITGLGPGGNPLANDLDLFLMDANGKLIDKSDTGLNGQSERISDKLPAGSYVVEIRSYYTKGQTGSVVFNSGEYRLSVSAQ
jgi:hypothetical protein